MQDEVIKQGFNKKFSCWHAALNPKQGESKTCLSGSGPWTVPRGVGLLSSIHLKVQVPAQKCLPTQRSKERGGYGNPSHVFYYECSEKPEWAQGGGGHPFVTTLSLADTTWAWVKKSTIANHDEWLLRLWWCVGLGRAQMSFLTLSWVPHTVGETILATRQRCVFQWEKKRSI